MIGVICSAVTGGLAASLVLLLTHDAMLAGLGALAGFLVSFVLITATIIWRVGAYMRVMQVLFPRPDAATRRWVLGKPEEDKAAD
jgi:hypothetical protein